MTRSALACALATALCCCTDAAAPTQTIVFVDAERMVRAATAELSVRVDSASDGQTRIDQRVAFDRQSRPLKLAIAPLEGDTSRTFTVTATAYDRDGERVATGRLVTGFVAGEKRFVVLMIEDHCIGHPACPVAETCHRGECVSGSVPARQLGRDRDDAPTSIDLLSEPAFVPDLDGGLDGGADAGDAMTGELHDDGGGTSASGNGGTLGGSGNGGPGAASGTGESGSGTGGTGGDGESGQGGAGGQDGGHRVCPINSICADVQLPDDFEGEATRVAIALYSGAPNGQVPTPQYWYGVQDVAAFGAGDVVSVTQDFSDPIGKYEWNDTFRAGAFHPGIMVFKSGRNVRPLEGVDYWYFTPARTALGLGVQLDLGVIRVELVPNVDDTATPGNDASGFVSCFEDEPCPLDQNVCCVRPGSTNVCQPPTDPCTLASYPYVARCDGAEDCPDGQLCCGNTTDGFSCALACANPRERTCHAEEDCGGAFCDRLSASAQHGFCDVDDDATPGDDRARFVQCGEATCEQGEFCCFDTSTCATVGCDGPGYRRGYCDGPEDCWNNLTCFSGEVGLCCGSGCTGLGETPVCHVDAQCPSPQTCTPSGRCCTPGSGCE